MKVLVLRGGALGDFLVTIPALQVIRRRWPNARVELIGNAQAGELGLLSRLLDAVHSQHDARWAALYDAQPLSPDLRAWLDSFDRVVNFWSDPDGALAAHFALRGTDFLRSHPHVTSTPAAKHFCDALGAVLNSKQGESAAYESRLVLPFACAVDADRHLDELGFGRSTAFIALHPGSGSRAKTWRSENWIQLARRLPGRLLIISGEADQEIGDWSKIPGAVRAHHWPLPRLASALSRASLYLGHDTGVSHLAAAVGTPSLLLFGPTDPAVWAPVGPHVRVIRRGATMDSINVDHVLSEVAAWPRALSQATPSGFTTKRHGLAAQTSPA